MKNTIFKICDNIIFKKIRDDYYIFSSNFNDYRLEGISSEIFNFICKGYTYTEIVTSIKDKYDVNQSIIENDVTRIINELTRFKILDLQHEDILPEEGKYENYIVNDSINNEDDEDLSLFDKAHKENIPINVDFHVTYKCNLRCKHCYAASQKENFYEQELTLEEIKKTFDQLDQLGTFYLRITGGEPFIHPQFKEIIEYAYLKKFAVSIVTNGTLLSDDIIDDLKRFKIRTLTFSLHGGDANVHDAFVGHNGAFEKLKENVIKCKNKGLHVNLSWVITQDSYNELNKIRELAKELGVPVGVGTRIVPQMDGNLSPKKHRLTDEQLRVFIKNNNLEIKPLRCTIGTKLQINSNGNVQPCLFVDDILGNVRENSIQVIWENLLKTREERYKNFYVTPKECEMCLYNKKCHRCPGIANIEAEKPNACSETAKWEAKAFYLAKN
ncbi:MAG: radical SAM protein [Clostridium sp.]|nr:radical SAM protein [Clostridium sp.]